MTAIRSALIGAGLGAASVMLIGLLLTAVIFYVETNRPLSDDATPGDRTREVIYLKSQFVPTLETVALSCAFAGALAGFASTFPPRPMSFTRCLAAIVVVSMTMRMPWFPLKGGLRPNDYVVMALIGIVVSMVLMRMGFRRSTAPQSDASPSASESLPAGGSV